MQKRHCGKIIVEWLVQKANNGRTIAEEKKQKGKSLENWKVVFFDFHHLCVERLLRKDACIKRYDR